MEVSSTTLAQFPFVLQLSQLFYISGSSLLSTSKVCDLSECKEGPTLPTPVKAHCTFYHKATTRIYVMGGCTATDCPAISSPVTDVYYLDKDYNVQTSTNMPNPLKSIGCVLIGHIAFIAGIC